MKIRSNGIDLYVEQRGPLDGPVVILIRGLGTQMVFWPDALLDGLVASGFRVVTFDNRDVGLSARCAKASVADDAQSIIDAVRNGEPLQSAYTLDDMALDVIGLMDSLDIERAHIFGISMGGGIAQLLALNHSARCLSVAIVMSAARFASGDLLERLVAWPRTLDEYVEDVLEADKNWGSPGFPMSEDDVRRMATHSYERGYDPAGINRQALATSQSLDRSKDLPLIKLPCMVIHGSDDTLIPPQAGAEIAALISDCAFHQVDGMGHTITPELAPKIVALLHAFIDGTDVARA